MINDARVGRNREKYLRSCMSHKLESEAGKRVVSDNVKYI